MSGVLTRTMTWDFWDWRAGRCEGFPKPDAAFAARARQLTPPASKLAWRSFAVTASHTYLLVLWDEERFVWLDVPAPVSDRRLAALRAELRGMLAQELREIAQRRESFPDERVDPGCPDPVLDDLSIVVTPFRRDSTAHVEASLTRSKILDLETGTTLWRQGGYYEGAHLDFETNTVDCTGDLDLSGRVYRFDSRGRRVRARR